MRCLTCKHCHIDFGSPGFSEMTPPQPGSWMCHKEQWKLDESSDGKDSLIAAFSKGERCKVYEPDERQKKAEDDLARIVAETVVTIFRK